MKNTEENTQTNPMHVWLTDECPCGYASGCDCYAKADALAYEESCRKKGMKLRKHRYKCDDTTHCDCQVFE